MHSPASGTQLALRRGRGWIWHLLPTTFISFIFLSLSSLLLDNKGLDNMTWLLSPWQCVVISWVHWHFENPNTSLSFLNLPVISTAVISVNSLYWYCKALQKAPRKSAAQYILFSTNILGILSHCTECRRRIHSLSKSPSEIYFR